MACSIIKAKTFPGIRSARRSGDSATTTTKNMTNFGLSRKSPRCAHCLKFQADDPSKVGEDEIGKLFTCSWCNTVKFCSRACYKMNIPFHDVHCDNLKVLKMNKLTGCSSDQIDWDRSIQARSLYATAIMGEDYELCEEFYDFAAKVHKWWNSLEDEKIQNEYFGWVQRLGNLSIAILLTLGCDEEAYDFIKQKVLPFTCENVPMFKCLPSYELFKNVSNNNEKHSSCMENFYEQDFFQYFLSKNRKL